LLVRQSDMFTVGVLPPLLMVGTFLLLAITRTASIARPDDGVVQAVVTGLGNHSIALTLGYALTLGALAMRRHVAHQRAGAFETVGRVPARGERGASPLLDEAGDVARALADHHGLVVRPVDHGRRLRRGLARLEHEVDHVVELLLDLPAVGAR